MGFNITQILSPTLCAEELIFCNGLCHTIVAVFLPWFAISDRMKINSGVCDERY